MMKLMVLSSLAATGPLAVAAVLTWIVRRAAVRHSIWTAALAAAILLPVWLQYRPVSLPTAASLPSVAMATAPTTVITVTPEQPFPWLLLSYGLGVGVVLRRYGLSLLALRRLGAGAVEVEPGVWVSAAVRVPLTYGIWKPRILLPEGEVHPLVVAHERMHIERGDLWANALAGVVTAVYWFHPLVWFAAARLRREAEFAVDDAIVGGADGLDYAEQLLRVARTSYPVAALAAGGQLEPRLKAILDPSRDRRPANRRVWMAAACAVTLPVLLFGQSPSLSGTVFNAAYAEVRLSQAGVEKAKTNASADGEYSFSRVDPGTYSLAVNGRPIMEVVLGEQPMTLDIHYRPAPTGPGVRVGGNVMAAKLTNKIAPKYPPAMKAQGIQGSVMLHVVIDTEGRVSECDVIATPHAELAESAMTAVRQWTYEKTLLNGNPVAVQTQVQVNYTLTR